MPKRSIFYIYLTQRSKKILGRNIFIFMECSSYMAIIGKFNVLCELGKESLSQKLSNSVKSIGVVLKFIFSVAINFLFFSWAVSQ